MLGEGAARPIGLEVEIVLCIGTSRLAAVEDNENATQCAADRATNVGPGDERRRLGLTVVTKCG